MSWDDLPETLSRERLAAMFVQALIAKLEEYPDHATMMAVIKDGFRLADAFTEKAKEPKK